MASSDPYPSDDERSRRIVRGLCAFLHRFRIPVGAVYAVVIVAVTANGIHRALDETRSSEFRSFCEIVQESIAEDHDHYETIAHRRAYPPFFAIAFAPFGLLPTTVGAVFFYVACAAFTLISVWLCARSCAGQVGVHGAALLLLPLPSIYILSAIARGETDLLVLLPLSGALALMIRGGRRSDAAAGALLGFAAALKLTPALFGPFLLIQRRWTALAAMVLSGVVLVGGLGVAVWGVDGTIERHRSWVENVLKPYSAEGPSAFIERPYRAINQSPTAALFRLLNEKHGGVLEPGTSAKINIVNLRPETVRRIASGIKLLVLAALAVCWWGAAKSPSRIVFSAAFASVVLGMLLLSDVSLRTHHVTLLFPFGVCIAVLASDLAGPARWLIEAVFPASLLLLLIGVFHIGKIMSTLVLADVLLLAGMLGIMLAHGRAESSDRSP